MQEHLGAAEQRAFVDVMRYLYITACLDLHLYPNES